MIKVGIFLSIFMVASCSSPESGEGFEKHVRSFDNIKIDYGLNNPSSEQFIWLDNDQLLSFSVVKENDSIRKGLFLVNLNGETQQIIDGVISDFCVLDKKILIQGFEGYPNIIGEVPGYSLVVLSENKILKTDEKQYSFLRCGFYKVPDDSVAIFRVLKIDDGFIKVTIEDDYLQKKHYLTQEQIDSVLSEGHPEKKRRLLVKYRDLHRKEYAKPIWVLNHLMPETEESKTFDGKWLAPGFFKYRPFSDSYISYRNDGNFISIWHVNINNGSVDYEGFSLPEKFVNRGSVVFESTHAGYILEHHNHKDGGLFLRHKDEIVSLGQKGARDVSVAPDGCHIAYGMGDILRWKQHDLDYRQTLKIADVCSFIKVREKKDDGH